MDYSVAEMSCVLNASVQCEACKAKVQEILQNIYGIYTITMDSEDGSVRICGRVNPRTFLKVIEKSGKHAEVKSIRFDGEAGDRRYYPYGDDPTNQLSYPHSYQSFPEQSHWFDRTYPNLPRPQPYPWQLMLPQPQPQPVPWPVIWPGWPPHQDNPIICDEVFTKLTKTPSRSADTVEQKLCQKNDTATNISAS